jgi:cyanophycinase-like exopeptidase
MSLAVRVTTPITTLALIGGGEFSFGETREIDEVLLQRMPAERRTIAFLPTASGSAEYAGHFGAYLKKLDSSVEVANVPVYRGRDSRRGKSLAMIRSAGMVYLGGGVLGNLLGTIRESPVDAALREAAAEGAVIAAIGAAASAFGAFGQDVRGGAPLRGLAWLPDTAIETGFNVGNDEGLRRLMSLPEIALGLGIPPKTALLLDREGSGEVIGDGRIAAFRRK